MFGKINCAVKKNQGEGVIFYEGCRVCRASLALTQYFHELTSCLMIIQHIMEDIE